MKILLILVLPFILTGCLYFNNRGISNRYYNECHEYYDSMGVYHKNCDKNLVEYKDMENGVKKVYKNTKKAISDSY